MTWHSSWSILLKATNLGCGVACNHLYKVSILQDLLKKTHFKPYIHYNCGFDLPCWTTSATSSKIGSWSSPALAPMPAMQSVLLPHTPSLALLLQNPLEEASQRTGEPLWSAVKLRRSSRASYLSNQVFLQSSTPLTNDSGNTQRDGWVERLPIYSFVPYINT